MATDDVILLRLTAEQAKNLSDILVEARDEGPEDEGWQSEELRELRILVDETISRHHQPH